MSYSRGGQSSIVYSYKALSFFLLRELISLIEARRLCSSTEDRVAMWYSVFSLPNSNITHMREEISGVLYCLRIKLVKFFPGSNRNMFRNWRIDQTECRIVIDGWLSSMHNIRTVLQIFIDSLCVPSPALLFSLF